MANCQKLKFALVQEGYVHHLELRVGEYAFIGRHRCALVVNDVSVSAQHVELSTVATGSGLCLQAKDTSQNGTGIIDPLPNGVAIVPEDSSSVRQLCSDAPERLQEGAALVVPLRRKGRHGKIQASTHNTFFVRFQLNGAQATFKCQSPTPFARNLSGGQPLPPQPLLASSPRSGTAAAAGLSDRRGSEQLSGGGGGGAHASKVKPGTVVPHSIASGLPHAYNPATGAGRWRYESQIGEGGLGVVYRARDCVGPLGEVAVKVLKFYERQNWGKQHAFSMHRESQWSMGLLHKEDDPRFHPQAAALFVRYLEDHTGFVEMGPREFEEKRRRYEAPGFDWERDGPRLPEQPYVVMELARGEPLHAAIDRTWRPPPRRPPHEGEPPPLSTAEKREVLVHAARALEYLTRFGLIHRDFRGCNMHLEERDRSGSRCRLRVLDLGVMISSEDGQQWNSNHAVQAFHRRGDTEEKKRRYDWLPWEVRAGADGSGPAVNFSPPAHSFDVFSLGVLILHLLLGRTEGREALETIRCHPTENKMPDTTVLGIQPALLRRMLGDAHQRPHPRELLQVLQVAVLGPVIGTEESTAPAVSHTRTASSCSRSCSPRRGYNWKRRLPPRRRSGHQRTRMVAGKAGGPSRSPSDARCRSQRRGSRSRSRPGGKAFVDAVEKCSAAIVREDSTEDMEDPDLEDFVTHAEASECWLLTFPLAQAWDGK